MIKMDQIIYRVAVIGLGAVGTRMISNMHVHGRFQPVVGFDTSADVPHYWHKRQV
jgi:3-hydroxyisobutyrate dehydrogenase-like beta-hydroxyacid dehydrogenase